MADFNQQINYAIFLRIEPQDSPRPAGIHSNENVRVWRVTLGDPPLLEAASTAAVTRRTPATYKTAILMWAVLFPLTIFLRWIVSLFSLTLSPLAQTGMMMAIEIILFSYLVMPQLATSFGFWLYPEAKARKTKS